MTIARSLVAVTASLGLSVTAVVTLTFVDSTRSEATVTSGDAIAASTDVRATETYSSTRPHKTIKPRGKMKLVKSGGEVTLTEAQSHRQTMRSLPPPPRRPSKTTHSGTTTDSKLRTPADQKAIAPFRLNIGICGLMRPDGTVPGPNRCQPVIPEERQTTRTPVTRVVTPRPQDVTWDQVRSATETTLFPGLPVKTQPAGRTLVNLETIAYTDESRVSTTTVTLLGFPVQVEATPMKYSWNFGDGSPALVTATPGKPYPSKEIVHKYMKRGDVTITLTTYYAARFNVAGTGWQYADGMVPITGPATPLQVREAVPVLVDPQR